MDFNTNPALPWQLVASWADPPHLRDAQKCCSHCVHYPCVSEIFWGHFSLEREGAQHLLLTHDGEK